MYKYFYQDQMHILALNEINQEYPFHIIEVDQVSENKYNFKVRYSGSDMEMIKKKYHLINNIIASPLFVLNDYLGNLHDNSANIIFALKLNEHKLKK